MQRTLIAATALLIATGLVGCGEQGTYNTAVDSELATVIEDNHAQTETAEALEDGSYRIPVDAAIDVLIANPALLERHPLGAQ